METGKCWEWGMEFGKTSDLIIGQINDGHEPDPDAVATLILSVGAANACGMDNKGAVENMSKLLYDYYNKDWPKFKTRLQDTDMKLGTSLVYPTIFATP